MVESTPSTSEDAAGGRAAEQARLRKERREAKIKAGGAARLNRISSAGGGIQRDAPRPEATTPQPAAVDHDHADPEEVDISKSYYVVPHADPRLSQNSNTPPLDLFGLNPSLPPPPPPNEAEDPLEKLFASMMATPGGAGGDGGPSLFPPPPPASPPDRYASLWRLVHFAVALGLGLYVVLCTPYTGTRAEREQAELAHRVGLATDQDAFQRYFFWAFGTAETVLLTSRFFVDRGRAPPRGMLWTAAGFLPEPFKGNAEMVLRYGQILGTVRSDILVCIFVLGVCSWFKAAS